MPSPNRITTYKVLTSLLEMTINLLHVSLMERTLIIEVNRCSLELAIYNISFEWILGAINKAADCLSRLVTPTSTTINMLTASSNDGPAFHTRSHIQNTSDTTSPPLTDTTPKISQEPTTTPKPITADHLDTLL